jgi:hypothetical protein
LAFGLDQLLVIGSGQVEQVHSIVPGFGHSLLALLKAKITGQPKPWEDGYQQEPKEARLKT